MEILSAGRVPAHGQKSCTPSKVSRARTGAATDDEGYGWQYAAIRELLSSNTRQRNQPSSRAYCRVLPRNGTVGNSECEDFGELVENRCGARNGRDANCTNCRERKSGHRSAMPLPLRRGRSALDRLVPGKFFSPLEKEAKSCLRSCGSCGQELHGLWCAGKTRIVSFPVPTNRVARAWQVLRPV